MIKRCNLDVSAQPSECYLAQTWAQRVLLSTDLGAGGVGGGGPVAAGDVEQECVQQVEALRLVDHLHCEAETYKLLALASNRNLCTT